MIASQNNSDMQAMGGPAPLKHSKPVADALDRINASLAELAPAVSKTHWLEIDQRRIYELTEPSFLRQLHYAKELGLIDGLVEMADEFAKREAERAKEVFPMNGKR